VKVFKGLKAYRTMYWAVDALLSGTSTTASCTHSPVAVDAIVARPTD
jgi:hypothetical protein